MIKVITSVKNQLIKDLVSKLNGTIVECKLVDYSDVVGNNNAFKT